MSTAPLEAFIKKYQTARNYNSKEMRLTMTEAEEISTAVALLLAGNTVLSERIIALQERIMQERQDLEVSGGGFV